MKDLVIKTPQTDAQKVANEDLVTQAGALVIEDQESHGKALSLLRTIKTMEKGIDGLFNDSKRAADHAHKLLVKTNRELKEPLTKAREELSGRALAYEKVERDKAAAARKKAEDEAIARAKEQEKQEREAREEKERRETAALDAAAAAEGEGAVEKANRIMKEAISYMPVAERVPFPLPEPPKPIAAPAVAAVSGVSRRTTWTATVTDLEAFLAWVNDDVKLRKHYVEPLMPLLNQLARAQKEKMAIPGVEAVSSSSHSIQS